MTIGGVLLPDSAKERPLSGTIVSVGPGKYDPEVEGKLRPMKASAGLSCVVATMPQQALNPEP